MAGAILNFGPLHAKVVGVPRIKLILEFCKFRGRGREEGARGLRGEAGTVSEQACAMGWMLRSVLVLAACLGEPLFSVVVHAKRVFSFDAGC